VDLLTFEKNDIHWARKSMRYQWGLSEGVIRRRSNSTMTKRKRTNTHLQNTAQKTQLWANRNPSKMGVTSGVPVGQYSGQAKNDKQLSTSITLIIEQHQPH
jgi:hypothetical protein